ncbi:MAG: APC family permease, partial [Candidatus Heimdallarchaeota archaeon]
MNAPKREKNGELHLEKKSDVKVSSYSHGSIETGIVTERELSRELGFKEAVSIGLGGTIGGGVFSVLGIAAGIAGPAAIISFAIGGILGMFIAYSYSKLALRYPSAGGSYTYAREAFGKKFGGMFGWLLWTGYLASCSLYAYTFGIYFAQIINLMTPNDLGETGYLRLVFSVFATLLITLSTLINLRGVKETGKSQNIIVLIKLIILVVFIAITIPAGIQGVKDGNFSDFFLDFQGNPTNNVLKGLAMAVVGTSILFVAFEGMELIPNAAEEIREPEKNGTSILFVAFEGMELIPNAAEEIREPEKNIPRSIYTTVIVATILYLLIAFTALGGTDYKIFVDDPELAEYALAYAAKPILGVAGFVIISIGALFSTASAFNASLYGSSRLTYVMARERIFPRFFQKVSKKSRVPYISILAISGISLVMTLTLKLDQIAKLASSIFLLLFAVVS